MVVSSDMNKANQSVPATDDLLLVGYIAGAFGVRGQLRLKAVTDQPEHLEQHIRTLYIRRHSRHPEREALVAYALRKVLLHKPGVLVLTVEGITTREEADALRQAEVFIREQDAVPLAEDEYFLHELYDLRVETDEGVLLGSVREVLETGANDVLVVARDEQPDVLIPMIYDVVQEIDVAGGRVVVHVLEGLVE